MGAAKAISLNVRASQVSHLCFEVGGILGESDIELGAQAAAFDLAAFYAILGSMPTVPGHPARLLYDFLQIQSFVKPFTLAALRAEPNKAALSKVINARANAYYAKYANAPAIITFMNNFFSDKDARLTQLADLSALQWDGLKTAYTNEIPPRTGVVKTTQSALSSRLDSSGSSTTTGRSDDLSIENLVGPGDYPAPPAGGTWTDINVTGPGPEVAHYQMDSSGATSTSKGLATESQTITNTDYGYRIPYLEGWAQFERAQISLDDERFASFMFNQNLPYLDAIFFNELTSIDSDVYRIQIAYLNTILTSPILGTVTGIYKNPGDAVRPGESVIRVENSDAVFLLATLVYRGPISIGSSVTVQTTLFDLPGPQTTIGGSVVAVRGRRVDDNWEVIVKCNNLDSGGKHILPLGYHFDYDDTTVSIT